MVSRRFRRVWNCVIARCVVDRCLETLVYAYNLFWASFFGQVSALDAAGLVVAGRVEDEFADQCSSVAVEDADLEVVDEDGDFGAAASFTWADVVEAAVLAQGDDASSVVSVRTRQ